MNWFRTWVEKRMMLEINGLRLLGFRLCSGFRQRRGFGGVNSAAMNL